MLTSGVAEGSPTSSPGTCMPGGCQQPRGEKGGRGAHLENGLVTFDEKLRAMAFADGRRVDQEGGCQAESRLERPVPFRLPLDFFSLRPWRSRFVRLLRVHKSTIITMSNECKCVRA